MAGQVLHGGGLKLGSLLDPYAECVGDVAQSGEAGGAVPVGFVPLDLLLGHSSGRRAGAPSTLGRRRPDQRGGQLGERAGGEHRNLTADGALGLLAGDMRDAVSDSIVDDGHEQAVGSEGSGHQECHIVIAGGGFGGRCWDVAFPMVAGPKQVGGNDDGGCPGGDARVGGGAERWCPATLP